MFITETEHTGPVVRVWIAVDGDRGDNLEGRALDMAREHLGADVPADFVTHYGVGLVEVVVEACDLA